MSTQAAKPALLLAIVIMTMAGGIFAYLLMMPSPNMPEPAPVSVVAEVPVPATMPATMPATVVAPSVDKPNRMARDLKREQIWTALARAHELEPAAAGSAAPSERAAERLPELDPKYVGLAVRERLEPLVIDCYVDASEREPGLAGQLVFDVTLIGVEGLGGVVETAEITEGSTPAVDVSAMGECVIESFMGLILEPPPTGGRSEASFPFELSPR